MRQHEPDDQNTTTSGSRESFTDADITSVASPLHDLTGFQRDLFRIIADGDRSGAEIQRTIEETYGTRINDGRLYPNLDKLVEKGLVRKKSYEIDGRTNLYAINQRGRRELAAHRNWYTRPLDADAVSDSSELEDADIEEPSGEAN